LDRLAVLTGVTALSPVLPKSLILKGKKIWGPRDVTNKGQPSSSREVETAQATSELHTYLESGDIRGAATWLVERHSHEVLSLCRAMIQDAALAEDMAQEVFGRAFSGLSAFRGDASPRTWLLAIARNRCIDHLRSVRCEPWRGAPSESAANPDEQPDDRPLAPDLISRRDEVASALRQLTEGERAIVILRFRHGLEYSELANVFDLREGTVRMRMSRALARMRRALQPTMLGLRPAELEKVAMPTGRQRAAPGVAGRTEEPPDVPAPHPLVAVLGLLDPGMSGVLRQRLLESASAL
jgi:RNA polymerase sigma-70 factor (ECF subfamily)